MKFFITAAFHLHRRDTRVLAILLTLFIAAIATRGLYSQSRTVSIIDPAVNAPHNLP